MRWIPALSVHENAHSYSMRARLLRANGYFDNQVMLIEDSAYFGFFNFDVSPVVIGVLRQMDQWLTALQADRSEVPLEVKLRRAKPAALAHACFTDNGTTKIAELLTNDVLKCQLKGIDYSDYTVSFTPGETAQLEAIFRSGGGSL